MGNRKIDLTNCKEIIVFGKTQDGNKVEFVECSEEFLVLVRDAMADKAKNLFLGCVFEPLEIS